MESVYLTYTPYHILLASIIAMNIDNNKRKKIWIFKDFIDSEKFASLLHKWNFNPFDEIKIFDGVYISTRCGRIYKMLFQPNSPLNIIGRNVSQIKKYFKKDKELFTVFTFHDGRPESQLIEYLNYRRGGINIYVEDGTAVYSSYTSPKPSIISTLFHKIYFGRWFQFVAFQGAYKYTHKIMVLRPDLIRSELKSKTIDPIPKEAIFSLKEKRMVDSILEEYGFRTRPKIDFLLILPHSEFLLTNDLFKSYKKIIEDILYILIDNNLYIKYHPREKNYYLESINNRIRTIPQGIPVEAIYLYLIDNPPQIIIGDISTSLLTGKIILEKTTFISLIKILDINYNRITNIFKKVGIIVPRNMHELKRYLEKQVGALK